VDIKLKKPFADYVSVDELPKTGDATKFIGIFPFQIEGSSKTETRRIEWSYSGTQAAIDKKAGVDGLTPRQQRALESLLHAIERELGQKGERVYETPGQKLPIWGKKK
jgi:hypothetical protein